jgi:hypothetical protein
MTQDLRQRFSGQLLVWETLTKKESRKVQVKGTFCGGRGTRTHKPLRATVFKTANQFPVLSLLVLQTPFPLGRRGILPLSSRLIPSGTRKGMAGEWQALRDGRGD